MKRLLLFSVFVAMLVLSGWLQHRYDSRTNHIAEKKIFLTMPSGKTLKVLSFGYDSLMADMLFIWSIQLYGTPNLTNRYDFLEQIYDTITDISPQYTEVYIVGSWIMALELGEIDMAVRLLEKGSRNIPDSWLFPYECGYYLSKYKKDLKAAEKYFKLAAKNPDAPPQIIRRYAHALYMGDSLQESYDMWLSIYKNSNSEFEKNAAYNHLLMIKLEMDRKILTEKIALFKKRFNRNPRTLYQLVQAGLIRQVPTDFSGKEYTYIPEKGKIKAYKEFKWKK